jgi:hypothetical protein
MAFLYPIHCTKPGCANAARYKIAARWTDGLTAELKTYGLTCADCLAEVYRHALEKQKHCRLAAGEVLEPPGIYHLERSHRDDQLQRLVDLEEQLRAACG